MNELLQECFGRCRHDDDCRECDFFASCSCVAATEDKMEPHSGMTSFEAMAEWSELVADGGSVPGGEDEPDPPELKTAPADLRMLADFCRFLFTLDDYTLGILAEVIVPDPELSGDCTVAALARLHRCSRQALHRKMLSSARRYPELAEVLRVTLRKIGRSRAGFRRRESIHA